MSKPQKSKLTVLGLISAMFVMAFSCTSMGQLWWKQAFAFFDLQTKPIAEEQYPLNIYTLSVGKADAIVISCEGEYALIDAGTVDKAEDVEVALKQIQADKLKVAFASHPDHDHIGGLPHVLQNLPAECFVQPDFPEELTKNNEEQKELEDILQKENITITKAKRGDIFQVGSAKIEVIGPFEEYVSTNNYSLVLKLTYKDFSMLFCGDIEEKAEIDLLKATADLTADVIKIAHHGSKTSSSKAFLQAVEAKYAIISTGADRNHLPRTEVLQRIEEQGLMIYRTDLEGTINVSYAENKITITTEKVK